MKLFLLFLLFSSILPSLQCGVTLHSVISNKAYNWLDKNNYSNIITDNINYFRSGNIFPDFGYNCFLKNINDTFAKNLRNASETAHWYPFVNTSLNYLSLSKNPDQFFAFLLGVISHSASDIFWHRENGMIQALADENYNFQGSRYNYFVHWICDTGSDILSPYYFDLTFLRNVGWQLPYDDIINVYKIMGVDIKKYEIELCFTELSLEPQELSKFPRDLYDLEYSPPFLTDNLLTLRKRGVNYLAFKVYECWQGIFKILENGNFSKFPCSIYGDDFISKEVENLFDDPFLEDSPNPSDMFGYDFDVNENFIVVSDPYNNVGSGSIYLFTKNFTLVTSFSGYQKGGNFGKVVRFFGSYIASLVSAENKVVILSGTKSTEIFLEGAEVLDTMSVTTFAEKSILFIPTSEYLMMVDENLTVSKVENLTNVGKILFAENYYFVSFPNFNDGNGTVGKVSLYNKVFNFVESILGDEINSGFGNDLLFFGDFLIISAKNSDNQRGAIYVYDKNLVLKNILRGFEIFGKFGHCLDTNGEHLFVSAFEENKIYVYDKNFKVVEIVNVGAYKIKNGIYSDPFLGIVKNFLK